LGEVVKEMNEQPGGFGHQRGRWKTTHSTINKLYCSDKQYSNDKPVQKCS